MQVFSDADLSVLTPKNTVVSPLDSTSGGMAMSLFQSPAFDAHEQVAFCHDRQSGLNAIIAIHDTTRGPSLGGCRMWPYADEQTALTDVLRLSRGMTYKSAVAGLALGGGKSVIFGDPRKDKTPQLMEAMGTCVENLGGRYFVAEDSGTSVADIQMMATRTAYVAGATDKLDELGQPRSGDPSPATAQGVFYGIQAAVAHRLGRNDLDGVSVAIQGMGNVGRVLAQRLHEAGARLYVADLHSSNCADAARRLGASVVSVDDILALDVDVVAPCAMGAVINDETVKSIQARIVAGSANNQLALERHGQALQARGILYAPDYVINAGGVIDVAMDVTGFGSGSVAEKVRDIGSTLSLIFARSYDTGVSTHVIADQMALERLQRIH